MSSIFHWKSLIYWNELTSLFSFCIAHKHGCYGSFVLNHITWIAFISLPHKFWFAYFRPWKRIVNFILLHCRSNFLHTQKFWFAYFGSWRELLISAFYIVYLISCIHYSHYTIYFLLCMKTKWIFASHCLIFLCIRKSKVVVLFFSFDWHFECVKLFGFWDCLKLL